MELLMDMCSKKLAPNLPYMKSFLGWFEPLRNAIEQEQDREGKKRTMCSAVGPCDVQATEERLHYDPLLEENRV
ncbi:hypothetical protein L484_014983 [Morus notabilis]|uniref:Uncharacterized protein n=1 Tax=Morus notabilis TaxID=981085 RepID=W9SAI7_9ROSA|nr:hypothetical protein L484_014983 [Morus notabilis]